MFAIFPIIWLVFTVRPVNAAQPTHITNNHNYCMCTVDSEKYIACTTGHHNNIDNWTSERPFFCQILATFKNSVAVIDCCCDSRWVWAKHLSLEIPIKKIRVARGYNLRACHDMYVGLSACCVPCAVCICVRYIYRYTSKLRSVVTIWQIAFVSTKKYARLLQRFCICMGGLSTIQWQRRYRLEIICFDWVGGRHTVCV